MDNNSQTTSIPSKPSNEPDYPYSLIIGVTVFLFILIIGYAVRTSSIQGCSVGDRVWVQTTDGETRGVVTITEIGIADIWVKGSDLSFLSTKAKPYPISRSAIVSVQKSRY